MIHLFEYQNKEQLSSDFDGLEMYLDDIWNRREKSSFYEGKDDEDAKVEAQRFLQFLHNTGEIKSNKYVGVIHYEGRKINLLPKIFYEEGKKWTQKEINGIQQHILWWLSYCRKIRFPNYQTSLDTEQSDFFEVLIYLFAKYTRQLLSHSIYQQYEETRSEMSYIRGRLDMNRYISQNLSQARWHKVHCVFDPFVLDNRFNQIIKFVSKILIHQTENKESKKYLREILFTLDEVTDTPATAKECAAIQFNPAFAEFETVRDYCQLFLEHAVSIDYNNNLKLFAFLLPMEYLFEDFVYGFIEKEVDDIQATSQRRSIYLDQDKTFALRPDLILKTSEKRIIADTKYKMVYNDPDDPRKGISQTDLYQVLAYAVRYKMEDVVLLYPDTLSNYHNEVSGFTIRDEFADQVDIKITAWQLPVINRDLIHGDAVKRMKTDEIFEGLRVELIDRLKAIVTH